MIFKETTNVRQFLELAQYYDMDKTIKEISELPIPEKIRGYELTKTLDWITYGNRLDLSEINNDVEFLFKPLEIIAKMSKQEIQLVRFTEAVRFGQWVTSELKRFNTRDEKTLKYHFDEQEIKAGIKGINHGVFGLIDVIAKRMNITHDEVLELSQLKVYMMLKIDIDNANFQKKLRDEFNK
jgi:hypothetical protein